MKSFLRMIALFLAVMMLLVFTTACQEREIIDSLGQDSAFDEVYLDIMSQDGDGELEEAGLKKEHFVMRVYFGDFLDSFTQGTTVEEIIASDKESLAYYIMSVNDELMTAYKNEQGKWLLGGGSQVDQCTPMASIGKFLENPKWPFSACVNDSIPDEVTLEAAYYMVDPNHISQYIYYETDKGDFVYLGYIYLFEKFSSYLIPRDVFDDMVQKDIVYSLSIWRTDIADFAPWEVEQ